MALAGRAGILIDTNLLVLFVVGRVNRARIETFKRTRQYTLADYNLLVWALAQFTVVYTVPHILAEVSNLTDLAGFEGFHARRILRQEINVMREVYVPSAQATSGKAYERLGLVDAVIGEAARAHHCGVLTDDFALYQLLSRESVSVVSFSQLRARAGIL